MGGRGSNSNFSRSTWANILGKQGRPMSMNKARLGSNPNFGMGRQWETNCQRCVFAYEMRRRGYDVEAKPVSRDGTTLAVAGSETGWDKVMRGGNLETLSASLWPENTIDRRMAEWGEGSRAIVSVRWQDGYSGHVFIAERSKGKTVFLDPQDGLEIKSKNVSAYFDRTIRHETAIMRIDNLQPTKLIEKCVSVHKKE